MAKVCLTAADSRFGAYETDDANPITVIGAGDGCDVQLPAELTDGPHAAIIRLGHTAYLCDLGAPGGTTLNRRRIRWARLAEGDEIGIKNARFNVSVEEVAELVTGEQPSFRLRDDSTIGEVTTIDPVLIVGSDPGCDVVLYDEAVASRHALVAWTQDGPILRQLVKGKAVRLNDRAVASARLVSGDAITVGPYRLNFQIDLGPVDFNPPQEQRLPAVEEGGAEESELMHSRLRHPRFLSGRLPAEELGWERLWGEREIRAAETLVAGVIGDSTGEASSRGGSAGGEMNEGADDSNARETGMSAMDEGVLIGQEGSSSKPEVGPGAPGAAGQLRENDINDEPADSRQMVRMRARIAAAQKALDDRATRHLKGLNEERTRLKAFEAALRRKAAQLLEAAKENHVLMSGLNKVAEETSSAEASDLDLLMEAAAAERQEGIEATPNGQTGNGAEAGPANSQLPKTSAPRSLQERAAELAELVRGEQEELDRAESRFASLRSTIKRLRESVERSAVKQEVQKRELEGQLQLLRAEQAAIAGERERVVAQLQEIDARATKTRLQLEQATRDGMDLDNESERLTYSRRELVEKEGELRTGMEVERRRMRVRHAELQSKEAELACAARERRREIEAEVSRRKAALEMREAELRAHRAALEQAGRNELNKAAAELERVLDARLAGLATEVASRGGVPENVSAMPQPEGRNENQAAASGNAPDEKDVQQITGLASMLRETIEGRARRLTAVQDELQALRGAIGRLECTVDAEEATEAANNPAGNASGSEAGRRVRFENAGRMDERHSYRAGKEEPADAVQNAATADAGSSNPAPSGGG